MKTVIKTGYIFNFLKFIDKPRNGSVLVEWQRIRDEILNKKMDGEQARYVLRCLSQYDIFRFSAIEDNVKTIDKVLNQKISGYCIADRRYLCYSFAGDSNVTDIHSLFDGDNFAAIILIKFNNNISCGSYKEENAAVEIIRTIFSGYFPSMLFWAFRTLANKELFIIVKSEKLDEIEGLIRLLFRTRVNPETNEKAFSVVKRWICFNGSSISDSSEFLGKIKLFGLCNHPSENKFQCLSAIPPGIGGDQRRICTTEIEAVKSICDIVDKKRTPLRVNKAIEKLIEARCKDVPYCSVSHSILMPIKDDIANNSKNTVPYLFPTTDTVNIIEEDPASLLERVYNKHMDDDVTSDGLLFHGIELNKITKYILRKLRNQFEKTEYEDVLILLKNIYKRLEMDRIERTSISLSSDQKRKYAQQNLDILNTALPLLRYVCAERERPNLCSSWYDDGYYKTEISGFSKISNAASFLMAQVANLPWIDDTPNYEGICTFGCYPSYKQNPFLGVVNTNFQAILAPKHYFGIYHEIGHYLLSFKFPFMDRIAGIIQNLRDENALPKEIELDLVKEIFSDIFGHLYGIKNCDAYIRNVIVVCLDNITFDMEIPDTPPEDASSDNYHEYVQQECMKIILRLFAIDIANRYTFCDLRIHLKFPDKENAAFKIIDETLERIREKIQKVYESRKDQTLVFRLFQMAESIRTNWISRKPDQNVDSLDTDNMDARLKVLFSIYIITRRLLRYLFLENNLENIRESCWANNGYLNTIFNEGRIYDSKITYPQAAINIAVEKDTDVFSQNIAMIVSLSANYDRRSYVNTLIKMLK